MCRSAVIGLFAVLLSGFCVTSTVALKQNFQWSHQEPVIIELQDVQDTQTFISNGNWTVIGFFNELDSNEALHFLATANSSLHNRDIAFGWTKQSQVLEHYQITGPSAAILFNGNVSHPRAQVHYDRSAWGNMTVDTLSGFIIADWMPAPAIEEISPLNAQAYFDRYLPLAWFFVDLTKEEETQQFIESVKPVCEQFRYRVVCVYMNAARYQREVKNFGIDIMKLPALVINWQRKNYKHSQKSIPTVESVRNHFSLYVQGKLPANVRTGVIPKFNKAPVKVVVARTWKEWMLNNRTDAFIMNYAPWCQHCTALKPTWDELGLFFKNVPSILIAKIDGTENDVPLQPTGYPVLAYLPANNKQNISYYGEVDRSLKALATYVIDHATTLNGQQKAEQLARLEQADKTDDKKNAKTGAAPASHDEL